MSFGGGAEFFLGNVDSGRILNFTLAPKPWENCYFTSHERIYLKSIYHYVVFFYAKLELRAEIE